MNISTIKKGTALILILSMILSLSACGDSGRSTKYQSYIQSLLSANYLGVTDAYVKATGANEDDAQAMYLQNVTRLADNLTAYYGFDIGSDAALAPAMVELSKQIYSKAKFEVGKAYKDNNIYYVDVTIYPINILNQTNSDVNEYITKFDERIDNGEFNNYAKEDYEYEFASGIIGILADAVNDIEYAEPQTVTVRMIQADSTYYIGNEDLRNLDTEIISTKIDGTLSTSTDADTNTSTEAVGE